MNRRDFVGLCAAAFCLTLPLGTLASCRPTEQQSATQPAPYVSPYDWTQLVQDDNGRLTYNNNGAVQSRFGVDVSEHQGPIDWQAAAADGVEFALIRLGNRGATEGQLYLDSCFEANIADAKAAGILTGVYFFSQAINVAEAREEAEFVVDNLHGRSLDYPVAYDFEFVTGFDGRANKLTGQQISSCAEAFFEVIQVAGYETLLYGNKDALLRLDSSLLDSQDLWYAEYGVAHPTIQHDIVIWQYTNQGSVAGISTLTDLNIHFLPEGKAAGSTE